MTLDIAALLAQGYRIAPAGAGVDVTTPDGRHGNGATVEDAVLNVGAQIIPDGSGRRFLHRENGDVLALDAGGVEPEPVATAQDDVDALNALSADNPEAE